MDVEEPASPAGSARGRHTRRELFAGSLVLGGTLLAASYQVAGALQTEEATRPAVDALTEAIHTAQATPTLPASAMATAPIFSDVARVGPGEALRFLAGRHTRYPGADLDSIMAFSPADILETTDTDVIDTIAAVHGGAALARVYALIAEQALDALLAVYGDAPVVLALDAGHGGKRGVYYDGGASGTEVAHVRAVVDSIEGQAVATRYASITVRRIFNDEIGDDFGLPPPEDRKSAASLTLRNVRAAMLAYEAAVWSRAHPAAPVAVHVISVHFNAGSGGILVLHQGDEVGREYAERSIAYGAAYVAAARPVLNATGLLPYRLVLALGDGLSDDTLLYEPPPRNTPPFNPYTGADRRTFPRRYAMLQGSLSQRDFALGALVYHGMV